MTRVLVLGGAGMLGSMVVARLRAQDDLEVVAASRDGEGAFDAGRDDPGALLDGVRPAWVINAIGILASRIDGREPASVARAIDVNARFPQLLADAAATRDVRIVHAATDGVFSGRDGAYDESAPHDAGDVYGQTKSLGEAAAEHVVNLRCSIVGRRPMVPAAGTAAPVGATVAPGAQAGAAGPRSLLDWLLAQPRAATLTGYADQRWNGITTLAFAQLCTGIVRTGGEGLHGAVHIVPADAVTKAELLVLLARAHGRDDLAIVPGPSRTPSDRTLATLHPRRNASLWRAAGHDRPPSIAAMVTELRSARQ